MSKPSRLPLARLLLLGAVAPHALVATEVPLRSLCPEAPLPVIAASVDGRESLQFMIDTGNGAAGFILAESVAQTLVLPPDQGEAASRPVGVGGAAKLAFARATSLHIGDHAIGPLTVGVSPALDRLSSLLSNRIDGNIGHPFLSRHAIEFDYAGGRFRFEPAARLDAAAPAFELGRKKPLILVSANLGSRESVRFVIDTGSSINLLSPGLAEKLGLTLGEPYKIAGVGGEVPGRRATVKSVRTLGASFDDLAVVVSIAVDQIQEIAGVPIAGVIGITAFHDGRLTIDYLSGRIRFERTAPDKT